MREAGSDCRMMQMACLLAVLLLSPVAHSEDAATLCDRIGSADISPGFEQLIDAQSAKSGPAAGALRCQRRLSDLDISLDTELLPSIIVARQVVTDAMTGEDHVTPRAEGLDRMGDLAALRNRLDTASPRTLEIVAVCGNRRFRFVVHPDNAGMFPRQIVAASVNVMRKQVATLFKE